jgi:hypothetical protein
VGIRAQLGLALVAEPLVEAQLPKYAGNQDGKENCADRQDRELEGHRRAAEEHAAGGDAQGLVRR